jgi:hypothetical protein
MSGLERFLLGSKKRRIRQIKFAIAWFDKKRPASFSRNWKRFMTPPGFTFEWFHLMVAVQGVDTIPSDGFLYTKDVMRE